MPLRCSEESTPFLQHLQSSGHSEALGRGALSSRVGRCGEEDGGAEDRPTWTAGFDKGAGNRAAWPISAVSGQPGSSWSASSGLVSAQLACSHPGRGALAGRAGLSAPSGSWLGQCFSFKTPRFPRSLRLLFAAAPELFPLLAVLRGRWAVPEALVGKRPAEHPLASVL